MFNKRVTVMLSAAAILLLTAVAFPAFAAEESAKATFRLLSFSTLVGEIITFAILVWVVMKFVWPPLMGAIDERQKDIADGLAAGERGRQELLNAEEEKAAMMSSGRTKMADLQSEGEKRRGEIIDAAKKDAEIERARILEDGRREVESERLAMQRHLEEKMGSLIIAGAAQILQREVGEQAHQDIISSVKKAL